MDLNVKYVYLRALHWHLHHNIRTTNIFGAAVNNFAILLDVYSFLLVTAGRTRSTKTNVILLIFNKVGDCKAFLYHKSTDEVLEVTAGNRLNIKDRRDPGGRLVRSALEVDVGSGINRLLIAGPLLEERHARSAQLATVLHAVQRGRLGHLVERRRARQSRPRTDGSQSQPVRAR